MVDYAAGAYKGPTKCYESYEAGQESSSYATE